MQDTARSLFRALFALLALHPTMTLALPADIADGFTRTVLADGLANPVDFEIAADGRIFILDRFGKLWVRLPDGSMVLAADIPVYRESEAGLIGSEWGREITQSKVFNEQLEGLIEKYELKKLNPTPVGGTSKGTSSREHR